jgi:hypothetical protein
VSYFLSLGSYPACAVEGKFDGKFLAYAEGKVHKQCNADFLQRKEEQKKKQQENDEQAYAAKKKEEQREREQEKEALMKKGDFVRADGELVFKEKEELSDEKLQERIINKMELSEFYKKVP